jgi:hypothetical protein
MKKGFHKLEHLIDKLIPYILVALLIIIIITFFFKEIAKTYHTYIEIADYIIISIFALDLVFKYIRTRKIKKFIKSYWLDILAIFPFYLFLRAFEEIVYFFRFSESLKEGQSVLHAGLELKEVSLAEKEGMKIIKEVEKTGKLSRSRFAVRFLRPIARTPRLMKLLPYYERTTGHHHPHDKIKRKK